MAFVEILTGNDLTVEQWNAQVFREYIGLMWWKNWMGASPNAIIRLKDDLTKKSGDAINLPMRTQMAGGLVTGNAKGIGNEGKVDFFNERVVVDNVRHVIKFEDVPMQQQRAAFNTLTEGKDALTEKAQLHLDDQITTQLSDTSEGRVQGRYLYGAADSNYDATEATALANIDNAADQLTTAMVDIAKRKALIPINATQQIRPMRIMNGKNSEQWFLFVAHPYAIRDLVQNDAAWRNAQLNIPPQANSSSPIYTGSSFKGSWNGSLLYEYERINLVSSTIQTTHNFLLGANAVVVAWAQRSKFNDEDSDLGHDISFEIHEIRGEQKVVFASPAAGATAEDFAVIHVYAAGVAD